VDITETRDSRNAPFKPAKQKLPVISNKREKKFEGGEEKASGLKRKGAGAMNVIKEPLG